MPETLKNRGILLIVSGPSGVGKGALTGRLLQRDPSFHLSCSVTTRAPREGEVHGVHYYFVSEDEYDALLAENAFLEHADVHAHRYGTLKSEVQKILDRGENVLLEIDQQGALQVMKNTSDYVSIMILPPSYTELKNRLTGRGTETPESIAIRLGNAKGELEHRCAYQYSVVNDDLETAYNELYAIITAERHRNSRYNPIIPD